MKVISRYWKIPAYLMVVWGFFICTMILLGLITGDMEDTGKHNVLYGSVIFGLAPLIIGILLLKKLKSDFKLMDQKRTLKNLLILAKQNNGNLTISEVIIKLNLTEKEARDILNQQVVNGLATLELTEDGNTYYDFKDY